MHCGLDFFNGDLASLRVRNIDQCVDKCKITPNCTAMSYLSISKEGFDGVCYMKKNITGHQKPNQWVLGMYDADPGVVYEVPPVPNWWDPASHTDEMVGKGTLTPDYPPWVPTTSESSLVLSSAETSFRRGSSTTIMSAPSEASVDQTISPRPSGNVPTSHTLSSSKVQRPSSSSVVYDEPPSAYWPPPQPAKTSSRLLTSSNSHTLQLSSSEDYASRTLSLTSVVTMSAAFPSTTIATTYEISSSGAAESLSLMSVVSAASPGHVTTASTLNQPLPSKFSEVQSTSPGPVATVSSVYPPMRSNSSQVTTTLLRPSISVPTIHRSVSSRFSDSTTEMLSSGAATSSEWEWLSHTSTSTLDYSGILRHSKTPLSISVAAPVWSSSSMESEASRASNEGPATVISPKVPFVPVTVTSKSEYGYTAVSSVLVSKTATNLFSDPVSPPATSCLESLSASSSYFAVFTLSPTHSWASMRSPTASNSTKRSSIYNTDTHFSPTISPVFTPAYTPLFTSFVTPSTRGPHTPITKPVSATSFQIFPQDELGISSDGSSLLFTSLLETIVVFALTIFMTAVVNVFD